MKIIWTAEIQINPKKNNQDKSRWSVSAVHIIFILWFCLQRFRKDNKINFRLYLNWSFFTTSNGVKRSGNWEAGERTTNRTGSQPASRFSNEETPVRVLTRSRLNKWFSVQHSACVLNYIMDPLLIIIMIMIIIITMKRLDLLLSFFTVSKTVSCSQNPLSRDQGTTTNKLKFS